MQLYIEYLILVFYNSSTYGINIAIYECKYLHFHYNVLDLHDNYI